MKLRIRKNEELVVREGQIESIRVDTQHEIQRLQRQAEQQAHAIQTKTEQELLAIQQQIESSQKRCEGSVSVEITHKKQTQTETDGQVQVLNKDIAKKLRETSGKLVQIADECEARLDLKHAI